MATVDGSYFADKLEGYLKMGEEVGWKIKSCLTMTLGYMGVCVIIAINNGQLVNQKQKTAFQDSNLASSLTYLL